MSELRLLVTGSRKWDDQDHLEGVLEHHYFSGVKPAPGVIVHGDCPKGADRMAREWCEAIGVEEDRHPADWDALGKAAGFIRNEEMVELGADLCLAFVKGESKGTKHCAGLAHKAGIPVYWFEDMGTWARQWIGEWADDSR